MCEPLTIIAAVASTAGGIMQAQAQHNAQQAAVNRSNAIAQQKYQRELQIAIKNDEAENRKHDAELKAQAEQTTAYHKQLQINQLEANRATLANSRKKLEKETKAAFESQKNLGEAIRAQGKVLSTGSSGQSFLLQVDQAEKQLGFEQAAIGQSLYDSNIAWGIEQQGIQLDQYNADVGAHNRLQAHPSAADAQFIPYKPIKMQGPSRMGLMGAMLGAVGGGIAVGAQTEYALTNLG